jgi:hypothetical protein
MNRLDNQFGSIRVKHPVHKSAVDQRVFNPEAVAVASEVPTVCRFNPNKAWLHLLPSEKVRPSLVGKWVPPVQLVGVCGPVVTILDF